MGGAEVGGVIVAPGETGAGPSRLDEQFVVVVAVPSQLGSSSEVDQFVDVSPRGSTCEVWFPDES